MTNRRIYIHLYIHTYKHTYKHTYLVDLGAMGEAMRAGRPCKVVVCGGCHATGESLRSARLRHSCTKRRDKGSRGGGEGRVRRGQGSISSPKTIKHTYTHYISYIYKFTDERRQEEEKHKGEYFEHNQGAPYALYRL